MVKVNVGNVGHIEFNSCSVCCDANFYFYTTDVEESVIIDDFDKDMLYDRGFLTYIIEKCGKHMSIQNSYFIDDMIDEVDRGRFEVIECFYNEM